MAPSKQQDTREETRKQTSHRRREEIANRRVLIGLAVVAALVVVLIAAGVISELVIKPSQPVATVANAKISLREYQKRVKFDWFQAGQVTDPQGTSLKTLDSMVDDQLLREQAQQRGITVSDDEINETIEKSFGYLRVPPTPAPSPTPDPAATPSTEPTATPAPSPTPVSLEAYEKAKKDYMSRLDTATGMSEADFRKIVELDLLRQKLYDDVTKDVPGTGEQVHARHILVAVRTPEPPAAPTPEGGPTPDPNAPTPAPTLEPRDDAQALARIIEVQQKLGAGEDFAALALAYSDDPGSKIQGGDLGWFARSGPGQRIRGRSVQPGARQAQRPGQDPVRLPPDQGGRKGSGPRPRRLSDPDQAVRGVQHVVDRHAQRGPGGSHLDHREGPAHAVTALAAGTTDAVPRRSAHR